MILSPCFGYRMRFTLPSIRNSRLTRAGAYRPGSRKSPVNTHHHPRMSILTFSPSYLSSLISEAERSPRRRQFRNVHHSHAEPCQRLFNAIEPDSYIRPHRHQIEPRDETLIAIRGLFALITFNEDGEIAEIVRFGSEKYGDSGYCSIGVELPAGTWHSLIALVPGSVLMEVKAGPFNPQAAKEFAPWSPEEGSADASAYVAGLFRAVEAAADLSAADVLDTPSNN